MHKVFITSRMFTENDETFAGLREKGCQIVPHPSYGRILTEDEMIKYIPGIHGIILGVENMNSRVLAHADSLKTISRFGVGYDNIDIPAATEKGIIVSYVPGANIDAVADVTFGLMIAVSRGIHTGWNLVKNEGWQGLKGPEVWEKTLGIIGLGRVGKGLAKRARGFNMKVLAYDEYRDEAYCKEHNIELVDTMEAILRDSDYVSLHVPFSAASKNLIGAKELDMMKPTAFLINAARGGIVDEQALYTCLKEKRIAGAALDVLAVEPVEKGHKLLELDNILITPHIGGNSYEAVQRTKLISIENLLAGLNGIMNENALNRVG